MGASGSLVNLRLMMRPPGDHQWRMGFWVVDHAAGHAIDGFDEFRVDNRFGITLGDYCAFSHGDDVVGVAAGLVHVMKDGDQGGAVFPVELAAELQHLDLVRWV